MMRSVCLVVSLAALTACVSVLPEKKTPEALYRFGPMDAAHTVSSSIMVREPEASRLFAGRAIAAEGPDGGLRLVPGVEWADSATRMMQVALLDSLGGEGSSVAVTSITGAPTDYEIAWRISDFTLHDASARCRLEATLLNGRDRTVIAQKLIETSADADSNRNGDRAKALTDAGRACVKDVAAFVVNATQTDTDD
ncbi:MAG: ABC-type transport auxiliary lipoprotein family protein [Hyphomonas sp.]